MGTYQLTIDGQSVALQQIRCTLVRVGCWTIDVLTVTPLPGNVSGACTIDLDTLTLSGFILRGGSWRESDYVRVVGGAGGLQLNTTPQGYANVPAQSLVTALLNNVGETLSTTAQVPTTTLPQWIVRREQTSTALTRVADALGVIWRVLPDGTVWMGNDTWPAATLTDPVLMDSYPERGETKIGISSPELLPWQSLILLGQGGNASDVDYAMMGEGEFRMRVLFED